MKAILCETFWGFLGGGVRILIWLKIVHLTNFVNLMGLLGVQMSYLVVLFCLALQEPESCINLLTSNMKKLARSFQA